jgi:hypothetical protein
MKRLNVKFPLVRIKWQDHYSDIGWHPIRECSEESDARGDTIAYLIGENDREYIISSTLMSDGFAACDPLHILKCCIIEMQVLETPAGFPPEVKPTLTLIPKQ